MHSDPTPLRAFAKAANYEVRFASLFQAGRALSFPCDAQGSVLLEVLNERARTAYGRAVALVGSEYATPVVWCADPRG
ncbi:MAG TPA: hypothetical protein VFV25_07070 [Methylibium sp.]